MRPLELRLRNFRSYFGDETVFKFRDRTLVGIVGPIGSGKSSILDAVSFALYGRTPTVASATRSLIHQRAAEATVALRFEVDGEVWEAVRMLRVKGQSQHALYRLDVDTPEGEPIEKITMKADVDSRIEELLGLEFDAFGRSVMLAQGRFAQFLRADPVERDKVLKGVFGHDRIDAMRSVARSHSARIGVELEKLGVRVEQLDRVATRLAERRDRSKTLRKRLEQFGKAQPKLEDLDARITAARDVSASADKRLGEIRSLSERMPDATSSAALIADASGASVKRSELGAALEGAQTAVAEADAALTAAQEGGVADVIEAASRQLALLVPLQRATSEAEQRVAAIGKRKATLDRDVEQARQRLANATAADTKAAEELATRSAGVDKAEVVVMEIRHADMAMTLRADLHDGDACPVCAQDVAEVPPVVASADLAAAADELEKAKAARDRADAARVAATAEAQGAREALAAVEAEASRIEDEATAARTSSERATAELDAAKAELAKLLGAGHPGELLEQRKADFEALRTAASTTRKTLDRIRSDHDAAIRDQQGLGKRLSALRVDVADLAARLDITVAVDDEDVSSLEEALGALRDAWSSATASLEQSKREAAADATTASDARTRLLEELGIGDDFAAEMATLSAEADLTDKAILEDQAEMDQATGLLEQRDELTRQRGFYEQIVTDLTDSRFVRYLLDDERTRLAALGSEHFERLSSGRYRFSEDGAFEIVDLTAAEAIRKADSLSGGETFLASLALALALAEMVARTGGRLDSFFLDEGFGSLDPEHLDLAMEGIEALVGDGSDRLVVVVSHVPELKARLEDLIVLDRNPVTGDTRVLSA